MKFLGNIIWLVFGGFISSLMWSLAGILFCITIIGLPLGMQCFKIAVLVLWPFGTDVHIGDFGAVGLLLNIIWILLFGWELFIYHMVLWFFFSITIIGIPFGRQHIKLARLAIIPFGAQLYKR